jgi:glycerol uptake facilitator-like aquaporin
MPASLMPVFWKSLGVTWRAIWRVTRQIFHEAMGTLFAVFALYGVMAVYRQWHTRPVRWVVAFAILYAVMMAVWAFAAFRRARRVR